MHKIVNGEKIEMSPEEESTFLQEQEVSRMKDEQRKLERETIAAQTEACWDKFFSSASMTPEEIALMKKCLRFN